MPFRNPIVAGEDLVIPGIRSNNYVEAVSGWRIGRDGSAQFSNALILGGLGASGPISGYSVNVGAGGLWLPDGTNVGTRLDNLDAQVPSTPSRPLPGQVLKSLQWNTDQVVGASSTTTEIAFLELDTGVIPVSGWYSWDVDPITFSNNNANAATFFARFRSEKTTNGTAPAKPTIASTLMAYGDEVIVASVIDYTLAPRLTRHFVAGERYKIALTYGTTSNTVAIVLTTHPTLFASTFSFRGDTADNSPITGSYGTGISLSTNAAPAPPVTAPTRHTDTFTAQWSRSFDANNAIRLSDDTAYCYQGWVSSTHGDTRSLVGFDSAAIVAALNGATNITATLFFTIAHTYNSVGTTFKFVSHTYAAKPTTFDPSQMWGSAGALGSGGGVGGSNRNFNLTPTEIARYANGTAKGFAVGPYGANSTNGYGYLYGATQSNRPYIVFSYDK